MTKYLVVPLLLFFSSTILADTNFLPDNDLWKQDPLYQMRIYNKIPDLYSILTSSFTKEEVEAKIAGNEEMFNRVIDAGYLLYKPFADQNSETLVINKKWEDPTVNANTNRYLWKVTINMYGGLARRPEISIEGFALVLCHELGHAYGGTPYIRVSNKLSAEGQADYYGSGVCVKKLLYELSIKDWEQKPSEFMNKTCKDMYTNVDQNENCLRGLVGGQSLGVLLSVIKDQPAPSYETPDSTVVTSTILSYPATVQCRLDTYFQGVTDKLRPLCWFKP